MHSSTLKATDAYQVGEKLLSVMDIHQRQRKRSDKELRVNESSGVTNSQLMKTQPESGDVTLLSDDERPETQRGDKREMSDKLDEQFDKDW